MPATVLLLLDRGRAVPAIAEDLGLDAATVYRYAQVYREKGLAGYLAAEQPGYWGLLTSAQLADKSLVQVFLPPYSPNLNLVECLWKFLRQKISNTAFYRTKGPFKTAVLHFFDRLSGFGRELASRMRPKFHVLDSQLPS